MRKVARKVWKLLLFSQLYAPIKTGLRAENNFSFFIFLIFFPYYFPDIFSFILPIFSLFFFPYFFLVSRFSNGVPKPLNGTAAYNTDKILYFNKTAVDPNLTIHTINIIIPV